MGRWGLYLAYLVDVQTQDTEWVWQLTVGMVVPRAVQDIKYMLAFMTKLLLVECLQGMPWTAMQCNAM